MNDEPRSDIPVGTPEGYTKEEPAPSETGAPGTPGEGLTAHHDAATHMDAHTVLSDDDHGHAEAALGPIDWRAWGYSVVGALTGVIVLYFFWVAVA